MQNIIRVGMRGDKNARMTCIVMERELYNGDLTPTSAQWLEELAEEGWPDAQIIYIEQALNGRMTACDWMKMEQWAIAMEAERPGVSYYLRSCMYNPTYDIFKDEKQMMTLLQKGVEHKHHPCCVQLAEYYAYEDSEEHSPQEIRDLLLCGADEKELDTPALELLVEVCHYDEDYEATVKYLRLWLKADPNDSVPCMKLGVMYHKGLGVRQNGELALKYFQKAANLGNADGLFSVGMLYFTGDGVRRNYKRAFDYFTRAAAANHADACGYLSYMCSEALGVNENNDEAVRWLEKGVALDDVHSVTMLAERCYFGLGVEQDIEKGLELLEKARLLNKDVELPSINLPALEERCVEAGYPIHKEEKIAPVDELLSVEATEDDEETPEEDDFFEYEENAAPDQMAEDVLRSLEANPTDWDTLYALQIALEMDCFDKEQGKQVVKILREHADESAEICITLGDMYYHGYATRRNYASSMLFYTKALEMDDAHPDAYIGIILGLHEELFKGGREAVPEWLEKMQAVGVEEPAAHYLLALLYSTGLYVPEDKNLAAQHLAQSEHLAHNFEEDLRYWQSGGKTLRDCLL